jgi:hypothetical protein
MFSLAISFGPQGQIWSLLFKEESKADEAYGAFLNASGGTLVGSDDFGQTYAIPFGEIRGMLIQDLDQMIESRIQHSLNDAKAQARYNARIKTDPEIRALQNGPAVLTPGFRN